MNFKFHPPMKVSDLKGDYPEVARSQHHQITPNRDVKGDAFSRGPILFKWMLGGTSWFVPSMSYFRIRCTLTQVRSNHGLLQPMLSSSDLSPNMGLAANLFRSAEIRLNGTTIERVGERLPQIDALKVRTSKGKSWLDDIGAVTNFWDVDPETRKQQCSIDGYSTKASACPGPLSYGEIYDGDAFGLDAAQNEIEYDAQTQLLTFTVNNGGAINSRHNQVVRPGDLISMLEHKFEIVHVVDETNAMVRKVSGPEGNVSVSQDTLEANQFQIQQIAHSSSNGIIPKNEFELVWQPPWDSLNWRMGFLLAENGNVNSHPKVWPVSRNKPWNPY